MNFPQTLAFIEEKMWNGMENEIDDTDASNVSISLLFQHIFLRMFTIFTRESSNFSSKFPLFYFSCFSQIFLLWFKFFTDDFLKKRFMGIHSIFFFWSPEEKRRIDKWNWSDLNLFDAWHCNIYCTLWFIRFWWNLNLNFESTCKKNLNENVGSTHNEFGEFPSSNCIIYHYYNFIIIP